MADRSAEPWYATAAYLYVLHRMARRWHGSTCAVIQTIGTTGCAVVANRMPPGIGAAPAGRSRSDARDAHPARFPDHDAVVQLYPDADPPPDALCFEFWKLPGHKHLIHDGKRLALVARWPGCCLRFVLAPLGRWHGLRLCHPPAPRLANAMRPSANELNKIAAAAGAVPAATVRPRPPLSALLELHTLALDAPRRVRHCGRWPKGCLVWMPLPPTGTPTALCAPARRLVRRANGLMRGGYRRLAQLPRSAA